MSRAHVTIQLGGIVAAVQVFNGQQTPAVLLVESHSQRDMLLAELAQLAQVCAPNTKVIVVGHLNDVVLYRELIRQGVSEYLVAPLHQLQIIDAIGALYRDPKAEPLGRITAFVGAKGGVGSSTLAHNFGWFVSKNFGIDTVITDLDLAFGTAGLNFNQETTQGIIDALGQPDRMDQTLLDRLLTKCGDKLSLLAASGSIDREFNIEQHAVETILEIVRHNVPSVVVDVPNMWAPWIKYTLVQADDVVITATPELASLRNAKNLIDLLKQARPNDRPPRLVLNQVGVPKRPEIPVAEFAKALGVDPSVVIGYDPQTFGTAASNGQMLADVAPKSKAAEAIAGLAQILVGPDKPLAQPSKSLFGPILSKLRKK
jgi:pilus assembly protein CpaE